MKILFILIDGLGDVSIPELNDKTPLQFANIPNMDYLAKHGLNGLLDSVAPGLACGSDTAHLSIFGYDPFKYYRGRGAFESLGAGLAMKGGDIAFKCNFATLDPLTGIVLSRRADRQFDVEGPILCSFLNNLVIPDFPNVSVQVKFATEHRCCIVLSLEDTQDIAFSDQISGTDPLKDNLKLRECLPTEPSNCDQNGLFTCKVVNALTKEIILKLSTHEINLKRMKENKPLANCVLLRGCGSMLEVPSFKDKHNLNGFMISPTCIIAGIGKTIGLDILTASGATGDYFSDFVSKGKVAVQTLQDNNLTIPYDFGFIHIKAVDDAGHDRNYSLKVSLLEKIDAMVGYVIDSITQPMLICVTSDHSTLCSLGDHSTEPVPFLACRVSPGRRQYEPTSTPEFIDRVHQFDELSSARGRLGRFSGSQVMPLLIYLHK